MIHRLDIRAIIKDHYCPFVVHKGRRFSLPFFGLFFLIPSAAGAALAMTVGYVNLTLIPLVLAAFGVLAAVMTGLLPIIHTVVGHTRDFVKLEPGRKIEGEREIIRIETLRELYSTISYSVIVLTAGIVVAVALVFVLPPDGANTTTPVAPYPRYYDVLARIFSGFVYFVGASTILSFLNIAVGVYAALEEHAERATATVKRSIDAGTTPADENGVETL